MATQELEPEIGQGLSRMTAPLSGTLTALAAHSALRNLAASVGGVGNELSRLAEPLGEQLRRACEGMMQSAQVAVLTEQMRQLNQSFRVPIRSIDAELRDVLEPLRRMESLATERLCSWGSLQATVDARDFGRMCSSVDQIERLKSLTDSIAAKLVPPELAPSYLRELQLDQQGRLQAMVDGIVAMLFPRDLASAHLQGLRQDPHERFQSLIDDIVARKSLRGSGVVDWSEASEGESIGDGFEASAESADREVLRVPMFIDVRVAADRIEADTLLAPADAKKCAVEVGEAAFRLQHELLAWVRNAGIDVTDVSSELFPLMAWLCSRPPGIPIQLHEAAATWCAAMGVLLAPPGPTRSGHETPSRDVFDAALEAAQYVRRILLEN